MYATPVLTCRYHALTVATCHSVMYLCVYVPYYWHHDRYSYVCSIDSACMHVPYIVSMHIPYGMYLHTAVLTVVVPHHSAYSGVHHDTMHMSTLWHNTPLSMSWHISTPP